MIKTKFNKQTRDDRKNENLLLKVCKSQIDIACEIILKFGNMNVKSKLRLGICLSTSDLADIL